MTSVHSSEAVFRMLVIAPSPSSRSDKIFCGRVITKNRKAEYRLVLFPDSTTSKGESGTGDFRTVGSTL